MSVTLVGVDELQGVTMSVGDWQLIDATVDNSVSIAAVDGDELCVTTGRRVRQAGWTASASHPLVKHGVLGWPPVDVPITIYLPVEDWSFVLAELARWAAVSESTGIVEERDDSARIERLLRAHLTSR